MTCIIAEPCIGVTDRGCVDVFPFLNAAIVRRLTSIGPAAFLHFPQPIVLPRYRPQPSPAMLASLASRFRAAGQRVYTLVWRA